MLKVYNLKTTPLLLNRLISLTAQYGYTVALNIILAQISVNAVLFLWCTKILGSLLSVPVNNWLSRLPSKKWLLIVLEALRAGIFGLMPLLFHHWLLFVGVLGVEIIGSVFSGNLMALIPKLVSTDGLSRFNAAITSVGSISYFIGPLLVGLFQGQSEALLFHIYSGISLIGAVTLLALPHVTFQIEPDEDNHFWTANFTKVFKAILSVKGLASFYLIFIVLDNMGTGMDSFEVLFVTKVVGMTSAQYAFSLSFLAIAFLSISSIMAFFKFRPSNRVGFQLGALAFAGYAILLVASRSIGMVLASYVLLAFGATVMGNMLNNMIQSSIADQNRVQVYIVEDVLMNILAAVTVFILGAVQNVGVGVGTAYVWLVVFSLGEYALLELGRSSLKNV